MSNEQSYLAKAQSIGSKTEKIMGIMDSQTFREFGHAAVDYMAEYMETIRDRSVLPQVEPGYLNDKLPDEVPEKGERWQKILQDFDQLIMPGITHWQAPQFHAFFPTGNSYPSIVGEILSAGLGVIGLHWTAAPACTELEVKVMNSLGKLLNLPPSFLNCSPGPGGGVLQTSASECTFICLVAAKAKSLRRLKKLHPHLNEDEITSHLIAYTSDQANSSVEKSGRLASIKMRILPTDENGNLKKETFKEAVKNDHDAGLFPCCMVATLGTTGICAFDKLDVLGPICRQYNMWLHVDAAYAGAAFILPEYHYLMKGIEYATTFNFNPHKWLLVNFDCSALWMQDANDLIDAFVVNRIYLDDQSEAEDTQLPEYRNWQIPLGRRFRSLKVWFTLRTYGKEGLQAHLRNQINLAKLFASLVKRDPRFELVCPTSMGLVCFRIKGENEKTQKLHDLLMVRKKIYMVTASLNGKLFLRFVICNPITNESDVHFSWDEITSQTQNILTSNGVQNGHSTNGHSTNGHSTNGISCGTN